MISRGTRYTPTPNSACPRGRRACDPTPGQWQQTWAEVTDRVWFAIDGASPVGPTMVINQSAAAFRPPNIPAADGIYELYTQPPLNWPRAVRACWALHSLNYAHSAPRFIKAAAAALAPGGLLGLTVIYWAAEGDDCAAGAATRRRIYHRGLLWGLVNDVAKPAGLTPLGPVDWTYRGDACGDHTWFALALVKGNGGPSGRNVS